MTAFHVNPLAAAVGASSRMALALAAVALSWGPLAGVAEAKGWGAHQAQVTPSMHARPTPSRPVLAHPMMAPYLALSSSLRRMPAGPLRLQNMATLRPPRIARLGGIGTSREPLRLAGSRAPTPVRAHFSAHPSLATFARHPLAARPLGRNAPLARIVREERIPVLEALRRAPSRR